MNKPGHISAITVALIAMLALYLGFLWSPAPEWDHSPQTRVITIEEVWTEVDYNYIPDVQIWGDGYIVWVEHSVDFSRRVLEGRLSQQEMTSLVRKFIELDFFDKFRKTRDNAGIYISVHLTGRYHSEWLDPENRELKELTSFLRRGAGSNGKELIPASGTLYAIPIERTSFPADTRANYHWPGDKFDHGLEYYANRSDGTIISGDELEFTWEVVNSPLSTVESWGKIYWIAVMIPGISE